MSHDTVGTPPVIKLTKDLSLFDRIGGNRKLVSAHVQKLAEAIKADSACLMYNPIIVNEKYEVIDGQHRLEAIRKLGMPVYYIQVPGLRLRSAQNLNRLSKPWSPNDYARSYAELGNKNYQIYLDFKDQYGLNHDILLKYLSLDDMTTGEMFRNGRLRVSDVKASRDLAEKLITFEEVFDRFKSRAFALAFRTMWANPAYDHDEMLRKLRHPKNKLEYQAVPEDYLRELERIYNKNTPDADRVRFF